MDWKRVCTKEDLVAEAGVAALINGEQLAIFYVPEAEEQVFAVSNWDPFGKANVMSRGLTAHLEEQWTVVSPLYKQHYNLQTGQCIEDDAVSLKTWPARIIENELYVALS